MTKQFLTVLFFSILFGATMEELHRHAPGVAVFVAATLGAQVYLHALTDQRIEKKTKKGAIVFRTK